MSIENPVNESEHRSVLPAMRRGMGGNCPSCGTSSLFVSGLKVQDRCNSCHEELYHHRADDLPAYLNIFIVGHIVVAATMLLMDTGIFGLWQLVALSCIAAVALAAILMRPLKGMVVGAQWAMRMHGFGGDDN